MSPMPTVCIATWWPAGTWIAAGRLACEKGTDEGPEALIVPQAASSAAQDAAARAVIGWASEVEGMWISWVDVSDCSAIAAKRSTRQMRSWMHMGSALAL